MKLFIKLQMDINFMKPRRIDVLCVCGVQFAIEETRLDTSKLSQNL
jgi:hypothetical protein